MRRRWIATGIFLLLVATPALALAQGQTGRILGVVTDPDGNPLPGVTVTLSGQQLISPRVSVTNQQGQYRFVALRPGTYTITYELDGFRTLVREGIEARAGSTSTVDPRLELSAVEETITVTGESPLVDVKSTNVGVNFDEQMLHDAPSGRDIWNVLEQQTPGVVTDRYDVGGSESGLQAVFTARGSSWTQASQFIDGVNVTDPAATGASDFYYDYDSFSEVQVSTGSHDPSVQTPGVRVNLVTKSGTNEFHGGGRFLLTDDALQSNNLDATLRERLGGSGSELDQITDGSVQLGGPFVEEKWTFFSSYRFFDVDRFVPGFPELESTEFPSFLIKNTYQANQDNRISGMYTVQTYDKPNRNASQTVAPEATWVEDDVFNIVQGKWNSVLSENAFLDVRFSFLDIDFPLGFQPDANSQSRFDFATGRTTGSSSVALNFDRKRVSTHASLNWYLSDWETTTHDFTFGFQFSQNPTDTRTEAIDDVNIQTIGGQPLFAIKFNTPLEQESEVQSYSFYAEDDISLGDHVTVGLGIRAEFTDGNLPEQASPAGTFVGGRSFARDDGVIEWTSIVPRVNAIWDIFGDGRTAVKASFSQYGNQLSTGTASFANPNALSFDFVEWNDLNGDLQFQPGEEGALLAQGGGLAGVIDPDFDTPITNEITAGIDQQFLDNWMVSGTFIYRDADDLAEDVNRGLDFANDFQEMTVTDPGPDQEVGTGDDGTLTVFDQVGGFGEDELFLTNVEDKFTEYKGVEIKVRRRFADSWNLLSSVTIGEVEALVSKGGGTPGDPGGASNLFDSPNDQIQAEGNPFWDRAFIWKTSGTYRFPFGLQVGGVLRSQSGAPFARILQVPLTQGVVDVFAEPRGSDVLDLVTTFDLKVAYNLALPVGNARFFVDGFNLSNEATVTSVVETTPADNFLFPLQTLSPRVVRGGVSYEF